MATVPTFTELLKGARLPEASHEVCLRADLVAEFERLERELERARKVPTASDSLNAAGDARRLAAQIEAVQEEMTAGTATFRMRALPKSKWRALVAAYPPREGMPDDAQIGVNRDDFLPALIRVSTIEPELAEEQWEALLGEDGVLTDRQFSDLADEAWFLNRGEVNVPFSRAVSQMRRDTGSE